MILRDLLDLVIKEKRRKEKAKTVRRSAVGISIVAAIGVAIGILFAPKAGKEMRSDMKEKAVNNIETIKETVRKKVEMMKDSAVHIAQEARNVTKDGHVKKEGVISDIKDTDKTVENISDKLNKSVK